MDYTHTVRGLNRVGLRRAGFTREQVRALQNSFARLFRGRRNLALAMRELDGEPRSAEVDHLLAFIRASRRGVAVGPRQGAGSDEAE
jgi:UDP-N-acetylglucosamine acyltransferase